MRNKNNIIIVATDTNFQIAEPNINLALAELNLIKLSCYFYSQITKKGNILVYLFATLFYVKLSSYHQIAIFARNQN
ncbi:MAG: hypothetical protein CL661_01930 [Bacteroidetes bacterium]|nr:hypothetical protein [Bacteroidota bacterium]